MEYIQAKQVQNKYYQSNPIIQRYQIHKISSRSGLPLFKTSQSTIFPPSKANVRNDQYKKDSVTYH